TVAKGQHKQTRAPILAALWITHPGTSAVIHLCFLTGFSNNHGPRWRHDPRLQLVDKAPHALIAVRKPIIAHQVLPDGHRIAATPQSLFDQLAIGLTVTEGWRFGGAHSRVRNRFTETRVGEHRNGRF